MQRQRARRMRSLRNSMLCSFALLAMAMAEEEERQGEVGDAELQQPSEKARRKSSAGRKKKASKRKRKEGEQAPLDMDALAFEEPPFLQKEDYEALNLLRDDNEDEREPADKVCEHGCLDFCPIPKWLARSTMMCMVSYHYSKRNIRPSNIISVVYP